MLGALFLTQTVEAIDEALRTAGVDRGRPVAVIGAPRVGRALAARGYQILLVDPRPRSLKRGDGPRCYASLDELPIADAPLAGLVGVDAGSAVEWSALLGAWSRSLVDGGAMVLVDKVAATEVSRRALCGGLAEIQQRRAGRTVVTSGLVTRL
jgi:hypothetical protein